MVNKRIVLWLGAVAGLWTAVASADTMSAFGLQYTSLGSATLSSATEDGVDVSNIGMSGGDGVSIALPPFASSASNPIAFSLDTSIDGTIPVGDYLQQTAYGPGAGGVTTALATVMQTQNSSDVTVTADFSNSSNGQPLLVEYYSGGPGGTLQYTSVGSPGSSTSTIVVPIGGGRTAYGDFSWSGGITMGLDVNPAFSSIITAPDGTQLPASDAIDFIDFVAPTNIDTLEYSSISLTGGGPDAFGSFAITGEALAVPEPSSWVLLAWALFGIAVAAVWKRDRSESSRIRQNSVPARRWGRLNSGEFSYDFRRPNRYRFWFFPASGANEPDPERSTSMLSNRIGLLAGLAVALSARGVSADTMSAFGLQYTSLGSATLSSATGGGVEVSNIGTSGSDGVSIALPPFASSASNPISFSLDTSIDGTIPVGDYLQQTAYGPGAGGVTAALATVTETETDASDVSVTANFANSSNGQPLLVEYYSGGPGGTLEHTYVGPPDQPSLTIVVSNGPGKTIYGDLSWGSGITGGFDVGTPIGAITAPDGTQLSNIDFIDFVAPTDFDPLEYSSISLTGGGPDAFGSFAITGEALAVPEPSSLALLALGALGLLGGIGVLFAVPRSGLALPPTNAVGETHGPACSLSGWKA